MGLEIALHFFFLLSTCWIELQSFLITPDASVVSNLVLKVNARCSSRRGSVVNKLDQYPWGRGFNPWPYSVGRGSGIAVSCGVGRRCGSDVVLLWLSHWPAAVAPIRPLAWEPLHAADVTLKGQKKKKENYTCGTGGRLKIVLLHNGLKWICSGYCLPSFPFAGTFLTSTSCQCCGTASCFGTSLKLSSWECLFQTGFMFCWDFLGLRSSEVTTPHCLLFLSFHPAGSCSWYFIATLRLLLSGALEVDGGGRKGSSWIIARRPRGGPLVSHRGHGRAESQLPSLILSKHCAMDRTGCSLPLIIWVLLISLYTSGEKLLGSLGFALKHLSYI